MTDDLNAPASGVEYPLALGSTLTDSQSNAHCTLRLDFVPASVDQSSVGHLEINSSEKKAELRLPSAGDASEMVEFKGKYEPCEDSLDCVAIFDGTSFRLERLDAHANLRHAPGAKRNKAPPPPKLNSKATVKVDEKNQGGKNEEQGFVAPAVGAAPNPAALHLAPTNHIDETNDIEYEFFHGGLR